MDDFHLKIETLKAPVPGSGWLIEARAILNGVQLPEYFVFCSLVEATTTSGRYELFTCSCGVFGCGGYWVDVECTEEAWVWRNGYAPDDEPDDADLIYEFVYRIPWHQVETAKELVRDALIPTWPNMRDSSRSYYERCFHSFLERS